MKTLAIAHLIGNALLLLLGYYWLGLGESSVALVWWSVVVLLFGFCGALWLHGTALVFFETRTHLAAAARSVLRNLLPLLVLLLVAVLIYWLLALAGERFGHSAFVIGSYATMKTRKPVAPERVLSWYQLLLTLVRWVVLPVVLFPLGASVAREGWRGFRWSALRRGRSLLYWMEVAVLLFIAIAVPLRLTRWIPEFTAFSTQFSSFLARFGLGYLLFVAGLLALEFFTSSGRPRESQPVTVGSP